MELTIKLINEIKHDLQTGKTYGKTQADNNATREQVYAINRFIDVPSDQLLEKLPRLVAGMSSDEIIQAMK